MGNKYTDEEWVEIQTIMNNFDYGLIVDKILPGHLLKGMSEEALVLFLDRSKDAIPYIRWVASSLYSALFMEFSELPLIINNNIGNGIVAWRLQHGK